MSDRDILQKIWKIMRSLLLIPYGPCGEIAPRKGTTKRECYRALWEIQELLGARRFFGSLPPQTNADRIRQMSDEELAEWILREPTIGFFSVCPPGTKDGEDCPTSPCEQCWLDWLKAPVEEVDE